MSAESGRSPDGDGGQQSDRQRLTRDRDQQGRARSARPRDALGRPLPYGAAGVPRPAENQIRTPAESLAQAQRLLDAGRPFEAHEVLEDAWKAAPDAERELWRGLAQLAVGLTHAARGNAAGAATLVRRGAGNLAEYRHDRPHGIEVAALLSWAEAFAADQPTAAFAADQPTAAFAADQPTAAFAADQPTAADQRTAADLPTAARVPRLVGLG